MEAPNITESKGKNINYFKAMEMLLYNYPKLKALVADKEAYTEVEIHERSKDLIMRSPSSGGLPKDREDKWQEIKRERTISYLRTLDQFEEIDRVVQLFKDRPEFDIIRMYYFNEDKDGNQRPDYAPKYTFEDIGFELGIDKDTARRRRNALVRDMTISMWGSAAAVAVCTWKEKQKGE